MSLQLILNDGTAIDIVEAGLQNTLSLHATMQTSSRQSGI